MSLRDRAAAGDDDWPTPAAPVDRQTPAPADEPLPDIEYTAPITDVDQVPVHIAWTRVMRDVLSIAKDENATIKTQGRDGGQGGQYSFRYRGIDKVLNAVGPALRRHGVMVIPIRTDANYGTAGRMRECTVTVTYRVFGPDGSHFDAQACGEGLDTGERATAKALTTAYRNWLVTALTIPTQDPKMDPDRVDLQRGEDRFDPTVYRDEALNLRTSVGRLSQMINDLRRLNRGGELVPNEVDEDEKLGNLLIRIRRERQAAAGGDEEWPTPVRPGSDQ